MSSHDEAQARAKGSGSPQWHVHGQNPDDSEYDAELRERISALAFAKGVGSSFENSTHLLADAGSVWRCVFKCTRLIGDVWKPAKSIAVTLACRF